MREADEIVDGPAAPPDPALRRAELDRYEQRLRDALAGEPSRDPAITALVDAGPPATTSPLASSTPT